MKSETTATVCSNNAPASRDRARSSADVNRWVAMIDAELQSKKGSGLFQPAVSEESVAVTVEFGRCAIDRATQSLEPGSSLKLDQLADEPLDLVVDGRPIARGELVEVDGQLGVRIVELLLLVFAWLVFGVSPLLADERPSAHRFDEQPEAFKAPLGTVRGSREDFDAEASSGATPLPRRSGAATRETNHINGAGWSATIWPLLFVVGLIVLGARWLKSRTPNAARSLPSDVFEVLGRKPIDPRTSIMLARCGSRLLLLSLSPHGLSTLAEITDPVEIDCLAGLCQATQRDQSLVETFRSLLHKPVSKPPSPQFNGRQTSVVSEVQR